MIDPLDRLGTHEVANQPLPIRHASWDGDPVLQDCTAEADRDALRGYARLLDDPALREAAVQAERHSPELRLFDRAGRRLDEVTFHPAYHDLLRAGLEAGYAGIAWEGRPGGHLTHAAMVYLASQVEPGHCCPMTMTYAAVPALAADPALAAEWVPKLTARAYDPSIAPLSRKAGATMGMAMTEKQGGSDLRANDTRAVRGADGWRLTGHKWFCSAPMSDGFLTLAQAPGGLTCFVVPRWTEEGRNGIRLMRLKDKLGNRANASAEIEYADALAFPLGEEGRGIVTILSMVHHTRLDTALAPAGLMRAALAEAHHWTAHRTAFQRRLIDQPLMRAVLADLTLDWEGATALGLAVARAFDDPAQRPFARIAVALAKFANNKRCIRVVSEAMEVLGGMGYVADTPMPMLYREAPLNGIWEGSGNVICLDILRTLARDDAAGAALAARLDGARGADAHYDAALAAHRARWPHAAPEAEARWFAESLSDLLTAAILLDGSPVAGRFCAARFGPRGSVAGSLPESDVAAVLERLGPAG
ncbi:putative acyl-CoA dehydrogenase [Oceaniovalibus guishaninsula JLT2003]|uniref:Putative acyl-CoA dehydrogenase n=1 Tax=Oceaniovalibus guishaninsula JLT2003 TaxID=1231392 RepID=K2HL23_9RHOB|nr:acyl-CoA dehydrogenase family protein [Oceaniovalibus guishaninsula]EKE43594.1 putative acyl-CoA dehydrogenase [Oceaniovalibus guishaninsula JLT2003]